jgi:hypothetical protein
MLPSRQWARPEAPVVHGGACGCRRHAHAQQNGGRDDAVGHADSAVDHLRGQAHGNEQQEVFPHPGRISILRRCGVSPWSEQGQTARCPMARFKGH